MGEDRAAGPTDAEGEVAVARLVLQDNDFVHALRHLADALALDPSLPETHEALAEVVARSGGAEPALGHFDPDPERQYIGVVAARAHLCAIAGRFDEAVGLLFQVAAHEPGRPWLDVAWLRRTDLPELLDPAVLVSAIATLAPRLDDPVDEDQRAPLLPALALVRACVERHPDHATVLRAGSMLARRLGAFDEAIAWTDRSLAIEPSHHAAVLKGYALRTAGRRDEALAVWTAEIESDPADLDLYVDVAELLCAMDRTAEGLDWVRRATELDPNHPKAAPTVLGLSFALDNEVRHLVELADQVRQQPDHPYAGTVLTHHCAARPWLGMVSAPTEAVSNMLSQMLEQRGPDPEAELKVTVSGIEPPSVLLALRSAFPSASVAVQQVPKPDPRDPLRRVRHQVWKYKRTEARAAVPAPPPEIAEAVRRVASVGWSSPLEAYDRAVLLSGLDPRALLSVLVFPPDPPEDELGRLLRRHHPQLWVRAVQTWTCLGIAQHRPEQPWASSTRREILADLLDGPEDWVSEAAAFAMVVTGWVDPAARADVRSLIVRRLLAADEAFVSREVTILGSLCHLVLATPDVDERSAALARDLLRKLNETS